MNDYDNGGHLIAGRTVQANLSGEPEPVVPYRDLFLAPDIEPADDEDDTD